MKELPSAFTERMKKILGDEYDDFEKAMHEPCVKAYRVNTDKISLEDFEKINIFGKEKSLMLKRAIILNMTRWATTPTTTQV